MSNRTDYHKYLQSDHWLKLKNKVYLQRDRKCELCGKKWDLEVHHINYDYNNTNQEIHYVRLICHTHHILCHWSLFGKVPMTSQALTKRYNTLKRQKWRRFKPSHLLNKIFAILYAL